MQTLFLIMKRRWVVDSLLILLFCITLSACSDEEDQSYPSVLTELVELQVGTDSLAQSFTTDYGVTYQMNQQVKAYTADTTLRCLCVYQPDETSGSVSSPTAQVYQMQSIFAQQPFAIKQSTAESFAPIRLISAWQTSRWVNLYIGIVTSPEAKHSFGFSLDTLAVNATTNIRTAHVSLLHHRPNNDTEDYTQKTYLSLPTYKLSEEADSLYLTVQTYEGTKILTYALGE